MPLSPFDRIERLVGRLVYRLPPSVAVRLSGEPPVVVDGQTLDPHVQLVRAMRRRRKLPGLCEPTPEAARARYRRDTLVFQWPRTPVGAVRDFEVPGGASPLRVRHYAPGGEGPRPLTVYLHGGGFAIGDLETHDEPCRILCREGGMHVLAVDYRLAPEHRFPAALDDTRTALRWAQAHAAELGADPARVGVGGDSAGAALAAVAALEAAREGRPPAAQLLVYPPTDPRPRPSHDLFSEDFFLSRADRATFSGHYLDGTGVGDDDPRVSPLLEPDLSGLPPALVVTAGFDILRDEGEAYAAALRAAGTPARVVRLPAHVHGFVHMTGVSPTARQALVDIARDWRALLDGEL